VAKDRPTTPEAVSDAYTEGAGKKGREALPPSQDPKYQTMMHGIHLRASRFREFAEARLALIDAVDKLVKKDPAHKLAPLLAEVKRTHKEYRQLGGLATFGE
jgi:hypothetical protein